MTGPEQASTWDVVRLFGHVARNMASGSDPRTATFDGLVGLLRRKGSEDIAIRLPFGPVLIVSGRELSRFILDAMPARDGIGPGTLKQKAMSFLAPNALTVQEGERWRSLRAFNEQVLQGALHDDGLRRVTSSALEHFGSPVADLRDVRRRMGQVMLQAVFGDTHPPARLAEDIQEVFGEVSLRTALFGSRKTAIRDRLKADIRDQWAQAGRASGPCLLDAAHAASGALEGEVAQPDIILDQLPHWMFTFTNSGSDLLFRTLALIGSRGEALDRVRDEIAAADPRDGTAPHHLPFLDACIWETGRLYPPVVMTMHRAGQSFRAGATTIPAGTELIHYFPLQNRNVAADRQANAFRPERWLGSSRSDQDATNLFLSGARACPGRELILHVIRTCLYCQLKDGIMQEKRSALSTDPLPVSYDWDRHNL